MILLDTSVLARILQPGSPHHQPAVDAVAFLHNQGEQLAICSQNIVEVYAIATRKTNGLAMTPAEALVEISNLKSRFNVLPDVPLHAMWEQLLAKYLVTNRLVFDLRLTVSAILCGCTAVLTFNDRDFSRFSEVAALNPFDVLQRPRF